MFMNREAELHDRDWREASAKRESGDQTECAKSRDFRPMLASLGKPARTHKCLAGAGGIEPPNGGIKIPCLTAWLRPNRPLRNARDRWSRRPSGNAGL